MQIDASDMLIIVGLRMRLWRTRRPPGRITGLNQLIHGWIHAPLLISKDTASDVVFHSEIIGVKYLLTKPTNCLTKAHMAMIHLQKH